MTQPKDRGEESEIAVNQGFTADTKSRRLITRLKLPTTGLRFLIVAVLVLGVFFRFVNLDRKFFWFDEVYTAFRISGYRETQVNEQEFRGRVIAVKDLQKYQRVNPEKGIIDTVKSLALEEPQLAPLHFVLTRFWSQLFGSSVVALRSLSALSSLLLFPSVYWLCLELFESSAVAWVAMAVIGISPLHVLYAQEVRMYSLWTGLTLLSCATLLRAMRVQTKLSWGIYILTLVVGIYTHWYTILVAFAHGVYVVGTEGLRWTKTVIASVLASLVGLLSVALWIFACKIWQRELPVVGNILEKEIIPHTRVSLLSFISRWTGNMSRAFVDANFSSRASLQEVVPLIPLILFLLILAGYSVYFTCRHTPKRVWLFILTLTGLTSLPLMLTDFIVGGYRLTAFARYLIPSYLGFQLAMSYLLTVKITSASVNWRQKLWQLATLVVLSTAVASCAVSSQAENWWNKGDQASFMMPIARIINQANSPFLISDRGTIGEILPFLYRLNPNVGLQRLDEGNTPKIPDGFKDIFVYKPAFINKLSPQLQDKLTKEYNYKLEPVVINRDVADETRLWKLVKQ
jgi:uncharacterized membrane protein